MFNISGGKKKLTDGEISALLKGYNLVPQENWASIPIRSHIRYYKKDGSFVRGGFVITIDKAGGFIHVANNLFDKAPNYKIWPLNFAKTNKIYAKPLANPPAPLGQPSQPPQPAPPQVHTPQGSLSAPGTPRNKSDQHEKKITDIVSHMNKMITAIKDLGARIDALEKRR